VDLCGFRTSNRADFCLISPKLTILDGFPIAKVKNQHQKGIMKEKMTENSSRKELTSTEQDNISEHGKSKFDDFISESLRSGGNHCVANKGHDKTRFLFFVAQEIV
jgi:hypothetical protein